MYFFSKSLQRVSLFVLEVIVDNGISLGKHAVATTHHHWRSLHHGHHGVGRRHHPHLLHGKAHRLRHGCLHASSHRHGLSHHTLRHVHLRSLSKQRVLPFEHCEQLLVSALLDFLWWHLRWRHGWSWHLHVDIDWLLVRIGSAINHLPCIVNNVYVWWLLRRWSLHCCNVILRLVSSEDCVKNFTDHLSSSSCLCVRFCTSFSFCISFCVSFHICLSFDLCLSLRSDLS